MCSCGRCSVTRGWSEFQTTTTPWTFLFPSSGSVRVWDFACKTRRSRRPELLQNHTRIRQRRGCTSLNSEMSIWCLELIFLRRGENKGKKGHACFSSCVSVFMTTTYHFWSFRKLMALLWSDMLTWLFRLLRSVMSRHRYTLFRLDATGFRARLERSLPDSNGPFCRSSFYRLQAATLSVHKNLYRLS